MEIVFECECHKKVFGKNIGKHISENGQVGHSHFRGLSVDEQLLGGI